MIDSKIKDEVIIKYDKQIPRYTSYPTAPHFYPLTGENYSNELASLPNNQDLSLYIHIPFCEKKCSYCRFASIGSTQDFLIEKYMRYLCKEIVESDYQ